MPRPRDARQPLTSEQLQLGDLLARTELTVPLIARRMGSAPSVTRYRVQVLFERLGVTSRRELTEMWMFYEFAPVEVGS